MLESRASSVVSHADRSAGLLGQSRAWSEAASGSRARATAARSKTGDGAEGGGGASAAGGGGDKDAESEKLPIVTDLSAENNVRGGLSPGADAFGLMDPTFTFRNVTHEVKDGKLHLSATMHCDYHWGVHGLGNKDVPSGTASFITADNYKAIADDIDPDKGDHPNAAAYTKYWSKAATEAHEKEHARDDWEDWGAQDTGLQVAKAAWEKEAVRSDNIEADLQKLQTEGGTSPRHPGKINSAVMTGSDSHYGVGMSYYSRPGEIKAHAVGANIERPLAQAVRAHGKQLEAQAEAKETASEAGSWIGGAIGALLGPVGAYVGSEVGEAVGGALAGDSKSPADPESASSGANPPRHKEAREESRRRIDSIAGMFG